jgi:hypothetical protein
VENGVGGVTPVQWSVNHLRRRVPSGQRVRSL